VSDVESSEEDTADDTPADDVTPPPTESHGPLSQVLAASGLFGRSDVPAAPEPVTDDDSDSEPTDSVDVDEGPDSEPTDSIDVTALETVETAGEVEAPDLGAPSMGASVGVGATDADLPSEPPAWMADEPTQVDQPIESTDPEMPELAEAVPDTDVADDAALDEVAGVFAEISFADDIELPVDTPDVSEDESIDVGDETNIESLVAELADASLEGDDLSFDDEGSDIAIDPDDTPSVYRELEALGEVETGSDEPQDPLAEITDEDSKVADIPSESTDWGGFEYREEAADSDAPIFGVTFGKEEEAEEETEEVTDVLDAEEPASPEEVATEAGDEEPVTETTPEVADDALTTDFDLEAPEAVDVGEFADEVVDFLDEADDDALEVDFSQDEPADIAVDVPTDEPSTTPEPVEPEKAFVETAPELEPEGDAAVPTEWGSRWQESAQGWVEDAQGRSTWRPIVTTSPILSEWHIDTYLGVVATDIVLGPGSIETEMATARTAAMRALVDEAMTRGAHAVVGVFTTLAPVSGSTVLTATGTAVTLKAQD
jgi:uncharacterized protein YbjQ (UPF0145 family)